MITFEEAREKILGKAKPLGTRHVDLSKLNGCYLASPIAAPFDLPAFSNSAVDGFGVHAADVSIAHPDSPIALRLAGVIQAGDRGDLKLEKGQTFKILTGAPVPNSVDAVVMKEFCDEKDPEVFVSRRVKSGENVRRRGDEFKAGDIVLHAGLPATPPVIGLLATLGYADALVYAKPRVAVISTGNELVAPGEPLYAGQIYDSNSFALCAALQRMGIDYCLKLFARDDLESVRPVLSRALEESDVIISAGGVSVGDYDIVKDVFEELGVKGDFSKIAIKPGKPVYFGTVKSRAGTQDKLIFGLPGNPVSALVTFHQLVAPAIRKMMGASVAFSQPRTAILKKTITKKAGRLEFVRGVLSWEGDQLIVAPTAGQDSHMLGGLCQADCLICFPLEEELLEAGKSVNIDLLRWID